MQLSISTKQQNIPLAKVKPNWDKRDNFGLIDTDGNYVLEPSYHSFSDWEEGILRLIKISAGYTDNWATNLYNGQYGFINAAGKLITDFSFGFANDFSDGLAGVNKYKKWGFIDTNGQLLIPFQFNNVRDFQQEGCVVQDGSNWGLINKNGEWKLENIFENLSAFAFGLAVATKKSGFIFKEKYSFIINAKGEKVVDLPEEWAWFQPVSEKLILIGTSSGYPGERTFGFMNLKGEIATQPQFYTDSDNLFDIGNFSDGMLAVRNKQGLFGFVNELGELAIPLQFESAGRFNNGIAKVSVGGKTFFIGTSGAQVNYREPEEIKRPFDEVLRYSEGLAVARKGKLWGVIDENNKVIVDFKYGRRRFRTQGDSGLYFTEEYPEYSCGLIGVNDERPDNIYAGYLNKEGKTAIDLKYRVAEPFVLNQ